jgi:hypothetical protein
MGGHVGVGSAEESGGAKGTAACLDVPIAGEDRDERNGALDQTVVSRPLAVLQPAAVAIANRRCLERVAAGLGDAV